MCYFRILRSRVSEGRSAIFVGCRHNSCWYILSLMVKFEVRFCCFVTNIKHIYQLRGATAVITMGLATFLATFQDWEQASYHILNRLYVWLHHILFRSKTSFFTEPLFGINYNFFSICSFFLSVSVFFWFLFCFISSLGNGARHALFPKLYPALRGFQKIKLKILKAFTYVNYLRS